MNAITHTPAMTAVGLPQMNAPAPDFTALTTHGMKSLADYNCQATPSLTS
ncbi:hypothetical protein FALB51S_00022 [Frigidibacter albus]